MTFTVASNSDGDYLPSDFILSANFGFGCAGGAPPRSRLIARADWRGGEH
jgi:hypothetical protein